MDTSIGFANQSDENELRDILLHYSMDLAGDIEDHVIIKQDDKIAAGGKVSLIDRDLFHLEVLGVHNDQRRTGAGGLLLAEILRHPWQYCHSSALEPGETFSVSTVSRGDAVPFYTKYGFKECNFIDLATPYNEQCDTCPDQQNCQPVPMVFVGGEKT